MVSINLIKCGEKQTLLAACDKELLGQKFSEGDLKIEVKKDFYEGRIVTPEEFEKELKKAEIANLVGEKVVSKAVELGLVSNGSVMKIQGVKHAQVLRL